MCAILLFNNTTVHPVSWWSIQKEAYDGISFCDTTIYNVDTLCRGLFHDLGRSRGEGPTIWKVKVYKATVAFVSTVRRFYNVEAHNFDDPYDSMDQQCKDSLAWRNLK